MKYCDKCKVSVAGNRKLCPLCQGNLSGTGEEPELFPFLPTTYHRHSLFFRVLILISVAVVVITGLINLMIPESGHWALLVTAGVGCVWASLYFAIKKRHNIPKNLLYQVVLVSGLAVVWDYLTGWNRWSIDFVIPIACVAVMLAMSVICKVMRMSIDDYIIYLIIDSFFGILPFAFYLLGWLNIPLPSIICVGVSILSFVTLLVFEGRNMTAQLKRRLHI